MPEFRRVPVVAAMYGTFLKNPEETRKFWDEVARGGKEYRTTPRVRCSMSG